jgi:hypothetical protein
LTEGPGVPQVLKERAVLERNAVIGTGNWAMRTEFMLGQTFEKLDWKMAGLMAGGAALGSVIRAGRLGQMVGSRAGILTRGLGARIQAGFAGAVVEGSGFAVANHALMGGPELDGVGWAKELAAGVMSLGLMRVVSFGGVSAVKSIAKMGSLPRLASLSQAVVGPASGFLGLWGAHALEVKIGLREGLADETTVINTLFTQATMGLLGQVGRAALGSGFAKFQGDMERRAGLVTDSLSGNAGRSGGTDPSFLANIMNSGPSAAPVGASVGGALVPISRTAPTPWLPAKGGTIVAMESHEPPGGPGPASCGRRGGGSCFDEWSAPICCRAGNERNRSRAFGLGALPRPSRQKR